MAETQTIVSRILIRGSLEAVWNEITKTDELQGAIFNMRLHTDGLAPGGNSGVQSVPDGRGRDGISVRWKGDGP